MKFLTNIDLNRNQLLNVILQNLASAPASPSGGMVYYNTSSNQFFGHNNTAFLQILLSGQVVDADIASGAAISLAKLATQVDQTILGNNTGGTASPIALTATQVRTLLNVANGSTVNSSDATLLNRANHTGTQASSTISDLATVVKAYRLDEFAAPTSDLSVNNVKITNVANGTASTDAVNLSQLQAAQNGLDWKASVRAASTSNLTLSGAQTIDGISIVAGDRVLCKNQSTASQNGIYVCASGAWSRATDADASSEVTSGLAVFVTEGTTLGDTGWVLTTNDPITLGSTSLVFAQFTGAGSYSAGNGISITGTTVSVVTANSANITVGGSGIDLAAAGTSGNYNNINTDSKGRVTSGSLIAYPQKYSVTFGDNSSTSINIVHSLSTKDITFSVRQVSDDSFVGCDAVSTSTSTLTLSFAVAPATNSLRCIVIG